MLYQKMMQENLPVSSPLEQQEQSGTPLKNLEHNCRTQVHATMFVSTDLPAHPGGSRGTSYQITTPTRAMF